MWREYGGHNKRREKCDALGRNKVRREIKTGPLLSGPETRRDIFLEG
jgi:hypothetical protein